MSSIKSALAAVNFRQFIRTLAAAKLIVFLLILFIPLFSLTTTKPAAAEGAGSTKAHHLPSSLGILAQATDPDPAADPDAEEDGQQDTESCESNGGDFSFFVCPVLRFANEGVVLFDNEIRKRTQITPEYYNNPELREVWGRLRNIAFILMIPIMLVLVIGTALGYGFIDAYTVKRAMPRLIFAVIFITLSYDIGAIMIDVSNAAVRGVQGILTSAICPGSDPECLDLTHIFTSEGGQVPDGATTGIVVGGIIGGAVALSVGVVSIGILVSFLWSAFLGLMIIFIVLLLRELIVILALIMLPLAILSWIFPGNDKPWKVVWGSFTGMLWAGPVFAAFVVLGRGLASITERALGQTGAIEGGLAWVFFTGSKLVIIVISLGGGLYVIISFAGAAGAVLGRPNDSAKGLLDRAKNFRGNKQKELGERAANEARFKGTGTMSQLGNRLGRYSKNAPQALEGISYNPLRARQSIRRYRSNQRDNATNIAIQRANEAVQDKDMRALFEHDNLARVTAQVIQQGLGSDSAVRDFIRRDENYAGIDEANLNQLVSQVQGARAKYGDRATMIASIDAMSAGGATDFQDNVSKVWELAMNAAGNDGTLKAYFDGNLRSKLNSGGRIDGGGGTYGDTAGITQEMLATMRRGGPLTEEQHRYFSRQFNLASFRNQGPQALAAANNKAYATENIFTAATEHLDSLRQTAAIEDSHALREAGTRLLGALPEGTTDDGLRAELLREAQRVASTIDNSRDVITYTSHYGGTSVESALSRGMAADGGARAVEVIDNTARDQGSVVYQARRARGGQVGQVGMPAFDYQRNPDRAPTVDDRDETGGRRGAGGAPT